MEQPLSQHSVIKLSTRKKFFQKQKKHKCLCCINLDFVDEDNKTKDVECKQPCERAAWTIAYLICSQDGLAESIMNYKKESGIITVDNMKAEFNGAVILYVSDITMFYMTGAMNFKFIPSYDLQKYLPEESVYTSVRRRLQRMDKDKGFVVIVVVDELKNDTTAKAIVESTIQRKYKNKLKTMNNRSHTNCNTMHQQQQQPEKMNVFIFDYEYDVSSRTAKVILYPYDTKDARGIVFKT